MTAQGRTNLKSVFETGDVPSGSDYADLIDSFVNIADSTAQTLTSDLRAAKFIATTEISGGSGQINVSGVNATKVSAANIYGANLFNDLTTDGDITVSGRIRSGAGSHIGDVMLCQQVTVNMGSTAIASAVVIPTSSNLVGIDYVLKSNEAATAAADLTLAVGTSGDSNQLATIAVSGGTPSIMDWYNARYTGVSASLFHAMSPDNSHVFVKVTNVSGQATAKDVLLNFRYLRKV